MNIAAMLMKKVTPLSEYRPEPVNKPLRKGKRTPQDNRNRHNEAMRRYKQVMEGKGWMTTAQITEGICEWNVENGFRRIQDSFPTLNKWSKMGIVEMRPKDDGENWGRRARYEWRWVE